MIEKIKKLSKKSQEILKIASCIGASFSFRVLQELCEKVTYGSAKPLGLITPSSLEECINNNYIQFVRASEDGNRRVSEIYRFVHDRIQQSAYSLIDTKSELASLHNQIGNILLNQIDLAKDPS